jgi:hypothetical protein
MNQYDAANRKGGMADLHADVYRTMTWIGNYDDAKVAEIINGHAAPRPRPD